MTERDRILARIARQMPPLVPQGPASARVWVLDDPRAGTSAQAVGIAERLGVPFRRVPVTWNWMAHMAGLARGGSLLGVRGGLSAHGLSLPAGGVRPLLVISSGSRSAAVALWLKARFGCRLVHCMRPGIAHPFGSIARRADYDLLVIPEHDNPPTAANILRTLGAPHRVSPLALRQAGLQWGERLDHLPHPRVALLVGGPIRGRNMEPARAHELGRVVARAAAARGGSILASTSRRTGTEASDALAAGLGSVMHLLYRHGEPGENPYLGFLAAADAVVVTADSVSMLSEACATQAPVLVALPELAGARHRRFLATLVEAGQVRMFREDLPAWPRPALDEAGRVATEIRRRFAIA